MLRTNCIFFEAGAHSQGYDDPPYCTFYNTEMGTCEDCLNKPCQHFYDKETVCNLMRDYFKKHLTT